MIQTCAIFVDAYRELNSKRLFWIVLALSGVVVLAFAALGVNSQGNITLLIWDTPIPSMTDSRETFYKGLFMGLGFSFWLSWLATILALISTAGIFVDLISSGAIELVLSKPITRLRLFVTKYLAGLLFVTAQVAVFSLASFVVLGWRGGTWEPGVFWGVPLVVVFFSYLFSICVLIGILTRSTIAALLLTLLIWLAIFGIHMTESLLLGLREFQEARVQAIERDIDQLEESLESPREEGASSVVQGVRDQFGRVWRQQKLEHRRGQLPEAQENVRRWSRFHGIAYGVKTVLPKTSETIGLLERKLLAATELEEFVDESAESPAWQTATVEDDVKVDQQEVQKRLIEETRERSAWWIVGTSVLFETFILGVAGWIFCRRDF